MQLNSNLVLSNAEQAALQALLSSPKISANCISYYLAAPNSTSKGVDVSFTITDITGIAAVTLLRNYNMDLGSATILNTWSVPEVANYVWSDTDAQLQTRGQAFYWIRLTATGSTGTNLDAGPQEILLNPQLVAPLAATDISASHAAVVNGTVVVTVNVSGGPASGSIKIYVSGYEGNPSAVAIAQQTQSPLQFTLDATGETITLEAINVSSGGSESPSGPTTTLLLDGVATVPAQPQGVSVAQIPTGNQITFPASREAVTSYSIYRAQRGQAFVSATVLATVAATSVGTLQYLDTDGLAGDWEYFIVAVSTIGSSLPSDPASPMVLLTSAGIPANAPVNTTNTATVDSIDTGSATEVRIYGAGGVGTSYSRITGYGSLSRPNGTINGLLYLTTYGILFTGTSYIASTTYTGTLPDTYELVGVIITTAATGVVGSGATVTLVIDTLGHVIQANPGAVGSGYIGALVSISGGGGSGAQVTPNVDTASGTIISYTVTDGGSGYATVPTGTVNGTTGGGTVGGGGDTGTSDGSRSGSNIEFLT